MYPYQAPVTCDASGARIMADGLLKAARLALESSQSARAADLARQAYALDPQRMKEDAAVYSLYLLAVQPRPAVVRVNNMVPAGCVAGCPLPSPVIAGQPPFQGCYPVRMRNAVGVVKPVVATEPSLRPGLPGVDPRIVAAMEKVLADAEALRSRVIIVVEEEQEPRQIESSVEITEPFLLPATAKALALCRAHKEMCAAHQTWKQLCEMLPMDECLHMWKEAVNFRVGFMLQETGRKSSWYWSWGMFGWSVEEVPAEEDD